jgi:hypothetical protein
MDKEAAAESFAKKIKFWAVLVVGIAGLGYYVATTFARSADLSVVQDRQDIDHSRIDVLQEKIQEVHDMVTEIRNDVKELRRR